MIRADLDALVRYYETLTPASVAAMGQFYSESCYFKDPFNEVHRLEDVQAIFRRMYRHLDDPRFAVLERLTGDEAVVLTWDFTFRMKAWRPAATQCIRGVTLLRFDARGRVNHHRDYWDAAEELYEKLPGIGLLMRALKRYLR